MSMAQSQNRRAKCLDTNCILKGFLKVFLYATKHSVLNFEFYFGKNCVSLYLYLSREDKQQLVELESQFKSFNTGLKITMVCLAVKRLAL